MRIFIFPILLGCISICFWRAGYTADHRLVTTSKESKMPVVSPINQDMLQQMAQIVANRITGNPEGLTEIFHETFLNKVPLERLIGIFKQFYVDYGRVVSVSLISRDSPTSGKFTFKFQKDVSSKITLTITTDSVPKVIGLFFEAPVSEHQTITEIVGEMKKLPGSISFMLAKLSGDINVLYELNPELSLAIGSTFKLYLLAALVEKGKSWSEIVAIKEEYKSMPSGNLHTWPEGSPITVHTLAAKMISESDNTATDHILHYLGREEVEGLLKPLGNRHPERSIPFLTTREFFQLKIDPTLKARYLAGDTVARKNLLDTEIRKIPLGETKIAELLAKPSAIDSVEWFASAGDLCRLMNYFYRKNDRVALEIMAINRGLDVPKDLFPYAGYKGGSDSL